MLIRRDLPFDGTKPLLHHAQAPRPHKAARGSGSAPRPAASVSTDAVIIGGVWSGGVCVVTGVLGTEASLICPAAVTQVEERAKTNPDTPVTVGDLKAWETKRGRIPRVRRSWCTPVGGPDWRSSGVSEHGCEEHDALVRSKYSNPAIRLGRSG
jgi:hypothetical protein